MVMKRYLDYGEVKKKLLDIDDNEHKAFLCLTYAVAGRVGEVVRHKKDTKDCDDPINPPISAEDIAHVRTPGGKDMIVVKVLTEKINQLRRVPVFPEREYWLIRPFWKWKRTIKVGYMFDYSTRWAETVFKEYFGSMDIHSLRHWRITHWLNGSVMGKPVPAQVVARMAGQKSLNSQMIYDHSVIEDYVDNLLG